MKKRCEGILQEGEAALLTSPQNLRYFTGFSGGEGIALVSEAGRYLFVDSRYTEAATREAAGFCVVEYSAGRRNAEIAARIKELGVETLAFEDAALTVAMHRNLQEGFPATAWRGASNEPAQLRMIKDENELARLRRAEQIGVDAFLAVLPQLRPGVAEVEIAAELEYQMRKRGGEGTSFETIVVSGAKSSMPHGKPNEKKLERGDFVTMDFGCRFGGYCSDMTRTVVLGRASDEQRKIYETVRSAQQRGLETIRAGILGREADNAARTVIEDAGYGPRFGHSLGHGVGLLIHELPNLAPSSEIRLEPGMVVTCEPGIYLPGVGGVRIEDMVCVTGDGVENLTHLDKALLEL